MILAALFTLTWLHASPTLCSTHACGPACHADGYTYTADARVNGQPWPTLWAHNVPRSESVLKLERLEITREDVANAPGMTQGHGSMTPLQAGC